MFKLARKHRALISGLLAFFLALLCIPVTVMASGSSATGHAKIEFSGGSLELLSVPSFEFGRHPRPEVVTYYAATRIGPQPMTIQDTSGLGWKLMAQLSPLSDGSNALAGVILIFNTKSGNIKPKTGQSPALTPPVADTAQVAAGGAAVEVAKALPGSGKGVWIIDWQADSTATEKKNASTEKDVELKVPATSIRSGGFQAKLDWDLINAP